ncbi:MAG: response regulator [Verrucomicrobia bacterium]|nr:response regulator [Verrucomicrobiota bacterium]
MSDPETRASVVRALEACRFLVEASAEWTDTMARVESQRFDVVVAEVEMPVVGGFDVLRAIRYNRPGTLVFLIGKAAGDEIVARARNLGAADYVQRPVHEHRLGIQIRTAWEEKANREMLRSLGIKGGTLRMAG